MGPRSRDPPAGRTAEVVDAASRLVNFQVVHAQGREGAVRRKHAEPGRATGRDRGRTHPRAQHAAAGEPGGARLHSLMGPGELGLQDRGTDGNRRPVGALQPLAMGKDLQGGRGRAERMPGKGVRKAVASPVGKREERRLSLIHI